MPCLRSKHIRVGIREGRIQVFASGAITSPVRCAVGHTRGVCGMPQPDPAKM